MAMVTIAFGAILSLLGLFGYFHAEADHRSVTALIPLFFGVGLAVCGAVVLARPNLRMHVMHVAVLIGLVGFLAAFGRLFSKLNVIVSDDPTIDRFPIRMVAAMAVTCLVYTGICIYSFIAARRRRKAAEAATP